MTARVYSPRQQQQDNSNDNSSNNNNNNNSSGSSHSTGNNSGNSSSGRKSTEAASSGVTGGASGTTCTVVAAAAAQLIHQHQLHQLQQLYVEESSTSPNPSPCTTPSPSPKLAEGRRTNKPAMEKRRRLRINQSLAALKALILDSARLENTKHSKLEKADILELTVRHLQRQRSLATPGLSRYKAGYQDCSREVARYLDTPDIATGTITQVDPAIKQRLLRHLDSCVAELDLDLGSRPDSGLGSSPGSVTDRVLGPASPNPLDHHPIPALVKQELPELEAAARPDSSTALPGDENNNNNNNNNGTTSRPTSAFGQLHPPTAPAPGMPDQPPNGQPNPNMLSVVQVIPSRLPDGQVVFLLPSHYVQLAAAAAANGISIGPNPPTAIWAATNMSLLKATDKLMKRPLCPTGEDQLAPDWQDQVQSTGLKPGKLSRLESEQPLDFTTSSAKKLKAAAARYAAQQQQPELATAMVSYPVPEDSSHGVVVAAASEPVKEEPKKPECSQVPTPTRTPSPGLSQPTVKDEEGMWRPW